MNKQNKWFFWVVLMLLLAGCASQPEIPADIVYINGNVLTVNAKNDKAEALAVRDGRIVAVGTNRSIGKYRGEDTKVVDLQGKTLAPGFIDGHSHFGSLRWFNTINISPPPVGEVREISDIVRVISHYKDSVGIQPGEWIFARGYDADQLKEQRHPVKEDLDTAFPDNPVLLVHASGHLSVVNSRALHISGINKILPTRTEARS